MSEQAEQPKKKLGDPIVLALTMGFIVLFLGFSVWDLNFTATTIAKGFAWTAKYFGSFFQLLLLLTFFIALGGRTEPLWTRPHWYLNNT